MTPAVLAIDLGTGGPKAAVVALAGEVLGRGQARTELHVGPGGRAEQDPEDWWRAVVDAGGEAMRAGGAGAEVRAVAVTGQWAGTVAVGADGRALAPAMIWMDARGAPHVRRVAGGRVRVAGYEPRKLLRWVRRTGGAPSLSGRDPLGHMLFLRHERPDVYRAADVLLEPVDYLGLRLTGRAATSAVTATLSWLTDTRDLARVRYDGDLVAVSTLDRSKLPEILPTGAVLGPATPEAAAALGLAGSVPVVAGTPDTMSAAVGSGAVGDHEAHLYVGTSSWLSCHVRYKRTDPIRNVASLPSALPGRYLVSCEQETAGVCVERLREALLPGSGDDGLVELNRLAGEAEAGSGGVLFTPWLNGERTPVDDHRVRGGLHHLSLQTTRAQLVRAVFEGVALNTRWMQEAVERFCRRRLEPLIFIGGGARSPLWCQMMADVLGRRVRAAAEPVDANVRGAALLAGLSLGALSESDIPARVPVRAAYDPDPALRRTYDEAFTRFKAAYKASKP